MNIIIAYLLIGIIINYGSIFIIWGCYSKICNGNKEMHDRIMYKNFKKGTALLDVFDGWLRIVMVAILWPINVYNTLVIGLNSIYDAKEEIENEKQ